MCGAYMDHDSNKLNKNIKSRRHLEICILTRCLMLFLSLLFSIIWLLKTASFHYSKLFLIRI